MVTEAIIHILILSGQSPKPCKSNVSHDFDSMISEMYFIIVGSTCNDRLIHKDMLRNFWYLSWYFFLFVWYVQGITGIPLSLIHKHYSGRVEYYLKETKYLLIFYSTNQWSKYLIYTTFLEFLFDSLSIWNLVWSI